MQKNILLGLPFYIEKNVFNTFLDEIIQHVPFLDGFINYVNYVPLDKCKCSWNLHDSLHIQSVVIQVIFYLILANSLFAFLIAKLISCLMSIIPEGNSVIFGTFSQPTCDHILLALFVIIFNLWVLYKLRKNIASIQDPSPPLDDSHEVFHTRKHPHTAERPRTDRDAYDFYM